MRSPGSGWLTALVTSLAVLAVACGEDSPPATTAPPHEPPAAPEEPVVEAPDDGLQEEARGVLIAASAAIRAHDVATLEQHVAPERRNEVLLLGIRDAFSEERWWEGLEAAAFPDDIALLGWEREGDRARVLVRGGSGFRPVELVRRGDRWLVTQW